MVTTLYRKLFPYAWRKSIYDFFLGNMVFFIRNFKIIARGKLTYIFKFALAKNEVNNAFAFIGRHGITSYPHPYSLEYKKRPVLVERDADKNLPFVNHNGKRLYFPEHFSIEKVKKDYLALLIEQDNRAAHRYVRSYDELQNRTLLDVGAAEGIFSLDTIAYTQHVIFFECMEYWQKPLQATFAEWSYKVTFVKKYVGDKTSGDFVALDDYLADKSHDNLFIKMDIEGAERLALDGVKKILASGKNIQLAICTYHRIGDPEYMENFMENLGYSVEFSQGLMYWNKRVSKGVIRCKN